LERRALYRGVFTCVPELKAELRRFIEVHNERSAKPFKWTKSASNIIAAVGRAKHALHNKPHGPPELTSPGGNRHQISFQDPFGTGPAGLDNSSVFVSSTMTVGAIPIKVKAVQTLPSFLFNTLPEHVCLRLF